MAKIGYADPPYIGCAHLYKDHPDYAGEVDHGALIDRLMAEYDGWILHASATPSSMAVLAPLVEKTGARWMTWVRASRLSNAMCPLRMHGSQSLSSQPASLL
ncbi:hypothetical protein PBR31_00045 [Xanthomonas phage PBR31]|uniref:Uncharacterized protein n=1 Tax=Xanthomonas phage PPDBI TaxID=2723911 RepID=A0A6H0X5S6_9CAUD|nr:hypothetical protein [Ralstonia pickettii]QIN95356.1 hypothetical protein PBR31_00045 [Xanthomonas phage PBR31]QIW89404.1 hypothetical protein PPDBI_00045 [Xanthomonas phage PPDBI]